MSFREQFYIFTYKPSSHHILACIHLPTVETETLKRKNRIYLQFKTWPNSFDTKFGEIRYRGLFSDFWKNEQRIVLVKRKLQLEYFLFPKSSQTLFKLCIRMQIIDCNFIDDRSSLFIVCYKKRRISFRTAVKRIGFSYSLYWKKIFPLFFWVY